MSSTVQKGFPPVPEFIPDADEHRRKLARAINTILSGKVNATIDATLRASQTTTTLTDSRIYATTFIDPMPLSANAATAKAGIWFSGAMKGSITINHASNAAVDQNFRFLLIG